jgi:hypothetical protein
MTMPNFFVIGAQKAGTTSLYHYLTQHPQIYMSPVKEPCFFNYEINFDGEIVKEEFGNPGRQKVARFSNVEEYRSLFRGVQGEASIGEASPPYIYVPGTAERIKRYVPEARVIAILRDPASRAYSAFLHAVRIGREPITDFAWALREEESRVRENWHYTFHYRSRGFYHAQLERYYEVFGRERVRVWLYEDLRDDPTGVAQGIYRFLGVDDTFVPDASAKHNPAGLPKNRVAGAMINGIDKTASVFLETFTSASKIYPLASQLRQHIQRRIVVKPPPMDPAIRRKLIEGYKEDILKLQKLIGRDLSAWLKDEDRNLTQGIRITGSPPMVH